MHQETLEGMEEFGDENEAFVAEARIIVDLPQGVTAELQLPPLRVEAYDEERAEHKLHDTINDKSINELIEHCVFSAPRDGEIGVTQRRGIGWAPQGERDFEAYCQKQERIEALASEVVDLDSLTRRGFSVTLFDLEGRDLRSFSG